MARGKPIGIKELIDSVHQELVQKADKSPFFYLEKAEIEIAFTVERDTESDINFYVVDTTAANSMANVQRIKVTLGAFDYFQNVPEPLLHNHKEAIFKS